MPYREFTMNQPKPIVSAFKFAGILVGLVYTLGCSPKVTVAAPDKPIEINLNVNIKHEIKVKVEKELEEAITEESGLF